VHGACSVAEALANAAGNVRIAARNIAASLKVGGMIHARPIPTQG
jgi:glycerate kinase